MKIDEEKKKISSNLTMFVLKNTIKRVFSFFLSFPTNLVSLIHIEKIIMYVTVWESVQYS